MITIYTALRVLRDLLLFCAFMHKLWPRATGQFKIGKTWMSIAVFSMIFACGMLFSLLFGRDPLISMGKYQGLAIIAYHIPMATFMGYYFVGLPLKASLLEGLVFTIVLRIGQMLYSDILVSICIQYNPQLLLFIQNPIVETMIVVLICLVFLIILAPDESEVDSKAISRLQIVLLVFALALYMLMRFTSSDGLAVGWASVLKALQCFCLFMFCYVVKRTVDYNHNIMMSHRNSAMLQAEYARLMQKRENDERIRALHHDLKHAISLVRSEDEAKALTDRFMASAGESATASYTQNAILNALLHDTAEKCASLGIRFEAGINIGACEFLDDFDTCAIFGNAFSNAIEATSKVCGEETCVIRFEAAEQRAALVFLVDNPCGENLHMRRGRLLSTKNNADNHGFGMRSIVSYVEKYNGTVLVDTENGRFSLTISIPKPSR